MRLSWGFTHLSVSYSPIASDSGDRALESVIPTEVQIINHDAEDLRALVHLSKMAHRPIVRGAWAPLHKDHLYED